MCVRETVSEGVCERERMRVCACMCVCLGGGCKGVLLHICIAAQSFSVCVQLYALLGCDCSLNDIKA